MKRNLIKVLLITSILFTGILGVVYAFLNEWNVSTLTYQYVLLSEMYVAFIMDFLAAPSFEGITNLIVIAGTGFGLFVGLLTLLRGLIVRRPLIGLFGFFSISSFFAIGVSLIIFNPDLTNGRFIFVILDGFSTNLIYTLFLVGVLGFVLLSLLLIFLLGLTAKSKVKVAKQAKGVPITPNVNQTLPLQPTLQAATPTVNAPTTPSNDNLSELVKVVMQEELNMMRNTQQIYPNPVMGVVNNPYATSVDLNLVKRIVIEELAKFQSQFISRAEAQTLIAQEIAMIKAQLRIK